MLKWRSLFDGAGASVAPFSSEARLTVIGLMALACTSLATVQAVAPTPRLIWNASASAPVGLYWVREVPVVERGDLVLAWLPIEARELAAERFYLAFDTPAVKRVVGLLGDTVCVRQGIVSINGKAVATSLKADHRGRPLSAWRGCRALERDEIFLLNEASPASFDGRYFGPSEREDVIGKLVSLWIF